MCCVVNNDGQFEIFNYYSFSSKGVVWNRNAMKINIATSRHGPAKKYTVTKTHCSMVT